MVQRLAVHGSVSARDAQTQEVQRLAVHGSVAERLKPDVERQLNDMLELGIISRSTSPMASPIVCVLKGPGGKDGVRIVCDFSVPKQIHN